MPDTMGVYIAAKTAGTEVSSTYEGRHLTVLETELIHPNHAGDLVEKGDPVIIALTSNTHPHVTYGQAVGVALASASAITDYIAIDTEGIFNLMCYGDDDVAGSIINPGDPLFISDDSAGAASAVPGNGVGDAIISKIQNLATQVPFGYALGIIGSTAEGVIAVKVHFDPNYDIEAQLFRTIFVEDPGADAAAVKITVDSDIAQTDGRLCALEVNLTPGAGLAAEEIRGAKISVVIPSDVDVAHQSRGLEVNFEGGQSFGSDCYGATIHFRPLVSITGGSAVLRIDSNPVTVADVDTFLFLNGDAVTTFIFNPLQTCTAWDVHTTATGSDGASEGHLNVTVGGLAMHIALYDAV